jgi:hypothetical protein
MLNLQTVPVLLMVKIVGQPFAFPLKTSMPHLVEIVT